MLVSTLLHFLIAHDSVFAFRYLNYAQNNRAEWAGKGEDIVASMLQKCKSMNNESIREVPQQMPEQFPANGKAAPVEFDV